jgi:hypothetical protein
MNLREEACNWGTFNLEVVAIDYLKKTCNLNPRSAGCDMEILWIIMITTDSVEKLETYSCRGIR